MVLAKPAGMKPRDLATLFARHLQAIDGVTDIEIAGPGFINIRVAPQLWADELTAIIAAGDSYGRNDIGKGRSVNVIIFRSFRLLSYFFREAKLVCVEVCVSAPNLRLTGVGCCHVAKFLRTLPLRM